MLKFIYPFLYVIMNFYVLKCSILFGQIDILHEVYGLIFTNFANNTAIIGAFNV